MTKTIEYLAAVLELTEPGAVTEPVTAPVGDRDRRYPDAEPARGHDGRWELPATSVAGSLRAALATVDPALTLRVMGTVSGATSTASALRVVGTRLLNPVTAPDPEAIDERGTAIDRHRAAARTSALRWVQTLPAGTRFQVFLRWDDPDPDDLAAVLEILASWQPLLGRGISAGRGRCRISRLDRGRLHLTTADGLRTFLTQSGPELVLAAATESVPLGDAADPETIHYTLAIVDPLHIGSGTVDDRTVRTTDTVGARARPGPAVSQIVRIGNKPVVPGRTLRGLLRSRSEFILRSIGIEACADARCGTCPACAVFGHAGGQASGRSVGRRSVFRVPDATIDQAVVARRTHAAIDRFTGGAADGLLFTEEVVEQGSFRLVIERFVGATDEEWRLVTALVALVVRDMHDGYLGVGAGTTRGHGTVEVVGGLGGTVLAEARRVLERLRASGHIDVREAG